MIESKQVSNQKVYTLGFIGKGCRHQRIAGLERTNHEEHQQSMLLEAEMTTGWSLFGCIKSKINHLQQQISGRIYQGRHGFQPELQTQSHGIETPESINAYLKHFQAMLSELAGGVFVASVSRIQVPRNRCLTAAGIDSCWCFMTLQVPGWLGSGEANLPVLIIAFKL